MQAIRRIGILRHSGDTPQLLFLEYDATLRVAIANKTLPVPLTGNPEHQSLREERPLVSTLDLQCLQFTHVDLQECCLLMFQHHFRITWYDLV